MYKRQERYHPPKNTTYDSVALTYQPLPMRLQNEQLHGIPFKSDWLTNGTAIQKVYLTVMHSATDLGLQFYFKYQLAELSPHDMEFMYYYLMKILFMGVDCLLYTSRPAAPAPACIQPTP